MMPHESVTVDPLSGVLAKLDRDAISAAIGRAMQPLEGVNRIVILGTAYLGRLILRSARMAGLDVCAFADNNSARWGTEVEGVPVLSPANAIERFNDTAAFVVGVFHSAAPREQLRALKCRRIVPYPAFHWKYAACMPSVTGIAAPGRILEQTDEMRAGYETLSDSRSRTEFAAQIEWRCTLDYSTLPAHTDGQHTYFDPEVVRLTADEALVDCGAFDGDTLRMFLDRIGGKFRRFYALEPDPANRSRLRNHVESLPAEQAARIVVLSYAAGEKSETVRFNAGFGPGSSIGGEEGIEVECERLDRIIDGPVTMIKMDIEGAEPYAIRGAAGLITSQRPILAVCAYHYCEHLWQLPSLIKSILPEYGIYLRRYAEECWETVIYAVPPERVIAG